MNSSTRLIKKTIQFNCFDGLIKKNMAERFRTDEVKKNNSSVTNPHKTV